MIRSRCKRVLKLAVFFSLLVGLTSIFSLTPSKSQVNSINGSLAASDGLPATFQGRIISLDRLAIVDGQGTFFTLDTIYYRNDGSEPISYFYICANETQTNQMYEMRVSAVSGERFSYDKLGTKLSGYNVWKIRLPNSIIPGGEINFRVVRFFYGALNSMVNSSGLYATLFHTTFPIVPYYTNIMTCSYQFPQGSEITDFQPSFGERTNNIIKFSATDSYPFNTQLAYFKFHLQTAGFVETVSSTVTVKPSLQQWDISDEATIINKGTVDINSLTFSVPEDASNFTAKDHLGLILGIADTTSATNGYKNVTINLKYNRYAITTDTIFTLTFSFKLPITSRRLVQGDFRNILYVDLFHQVYNPWLMRNVAVRIALDDASSIEYDHLNSVPEAVDFKDGAQYLIYRQSATVPSSSKVVTIMYDYSVVESQIRPLTIALVVAIVMVFLIIARKVVYRRETELMPVTTELPIESLKDFTGIFEEKVAAYSDLDNLNDDFQRRKVKKREYQLKVEDLTRRIKLLDNQVRPSKRKLIEFGGRFKEIIEELDLLEAERQSVQDSLITLERRYKDGQIKSRVAYEQLYDNYAVRLKKIQTSIDSGLNELKSYLT